MPIQVGSYGLQQGRGGSGKRPFYPQELGDSTGQGWRERAFQGTAKENERKKEYTRFSVLKNSLRRKTRLILAGETYPGTISSHNDNNKKQTGRQIPRDHRTQVYPGRMYEMCVYAFTVLHAGEEGGKGKKRNSRDPPILL